VTTALVIEPRDDTIGTWHGSRLLIELGQCDPAVIRSQPALRAWMTQIAAQTDMTPVGPPLLKYFGRDELAGETVIQVTETGNIDGHGYDDDQSITLCINSRNHLDPAAALEHTTKYFDAGTGRARLIHSYIPPAAAAAQELTVEPRDDTIGAWRGVRLIIDVSGGDPAVVSSSHALHAWIDELATRIGVVAVGQPIKRQTGDIKTLIQLIETSNIDAWGFSDRRAAGLCIFSCKEFDPAAALAFTKKFFDPGDGSLRARARVIHAYIPR